MATEFTTAPTIEARPEFADILRQEEHFSTGESDSASEQINGWFDKLMIQSGLEMAPSMLLLTCICSAILVGGLAFVFQENMLTTGLGAGLGAIIPIGIVMLIRNRRQKTMMNQMPGMIEELSSAAKTGRSINQCFEQVADNTDSPLGDELKRTAAKSKLGVPLPQALSGMWDRTGLVSLNLLSTALTVHHSTGGNIVRVLNRLQKSVQDRIAFQGRLRSATAASRATAILMLLIPPAVLPSFIIRDPSYMTDLLEVRWGRILTMIAVVLQIIGTVWILRVLKKSKQA